jgi:DNA-binding transcriptional MocR family regulator
MDEETLWSIRAFVYEHFAGTTRPPRLEETASHFGLTKEEVAAAYDELNRRHAVFLEPGTHDIAMAFPFSGVETPFRVHANGKTYFANCAWDTLGIPVALHADAEMEAVCAQSGEPIRLRVRDGQLEGTDALVHFLLPFRAWYDDLPFT